MNQPDHTRPWRSLTAYLSESFKDRDVKFLDTIFIQISNLYYQNLGSASLIVWDARFASVAISIIFSSFFIITFDWKGWSHWQDLGHIYQTQSCFKFRNIYLSIKLNFYVKKWENNITCGSFFRITSKIERFWKSIRTYPVFNKKMRNVVNYINNYAHSFFAEDF